MKSDEIVDSTLFGHPNWTLFWSTVDPFQVRAQHALRTAAVNGAWPKGRSNRYSAEVHYPDAVRHQPIQHRRDVDPGVVDLDTASVKSCQGSDADRESHTCDDPQRVQNTPPSVAHRDERRK